MSLITLRRFFGQALFLVEIAEDCQSVSSKSVLIDGDTVWLDIDCGFRVWTRQKVRLRGIDAPELPTAEGQRAKDFVVRALSELPFVGEAGQV